MKKNDGGYALPFALVVILVMGFIASAILSYSLSSYTSQKATTQRMVEKYTTMGEIEKVMAYFDATAKKADSISVSYEIIKTACGEKVTYGEIIRAGNDLTFPISISSDTVSVSCVIKLSGTNVHWSRADDGTELYSVEGATVTYENYTITKAETSDQEEEGGDGNG